MIELTPRLLKLPYVLASKHARAGTERFDELVSVGNEAIVEAARRFDPSRGAAPATYLYECAKWRVLNAARPETDRDKEPKFWAGLARLDEPLDGGGTLTAELAAAGPTPDAAAERADLLDRVLRLLRPLDRAVYVLRHALGLTFDEIGARLGKTGECVRQRLVRVERSLRRKAATIGRRRGNVSHPDPRPPRGEKVSAGARRYQKEAAAARHALGQVPGGRDLWYLADDPGRRLAGPSRTLAALLAFAGLPFRQTRGGNYRGGLDDRAARLVAELAAAGWRAVRGPEARPLAQCEGYVCRPIPAPEHGFDA